jgi:exopolyphosphatase/guanosine-5'-triphosphate,3'-diphosphate pyrophosphatase
MRVAVIDLGTNTFNLLVADVRENDFTIIHNSKEGVALGMGGINQRKIATAAMERALQAFELFVSICKLHTVEHIRAIGTSALRDAKNADELVNTVRDRFGITIEIIDGIREAQLIYDGVRWSYDFEDPSLIMDIGGGSTEFIRGYEGDSLQFCSLDIGVSRAVQLFDLNDPMTPGNQRELLQWFEQKSGPLADFQYCTTLVGSSGSFETFYEMVHEQPFPGGIEPIRLNRAELEETLDWIIQSTFEQRERHPYIIPIRRKMAPLAALKTKWILEKFDIRKVVISPCSLKEGVLREMIKKDH